ncbi:hypothetical protein [Nocardia sp. NRRL S-836]|uniref:hypothetical protein n=1 Tax=Nocardia sp. NRRL S-836 TaxID=1519492 RepID=UPI0006AF2782|nr:hypothetical protein [Nocardia sp. NRRL S-836]KOV82455.1 hypothetical protein ADL03_24345 [Nocardia sp. NRRL S-836]
MDGSTRRTAAQWALLCLLLLGVVGMHHVTPDTGPPAMSTATGSHGDHAPGEPEPSHGVLHLCMAVLAAVVPLLLGWLLLRALRPTQSGATGTPAWPRAPQRPPPPGGRALLSSLCVLRL